jgi:hypothetical protein
VSVEVKFRYRALDPRGVVWTESDDLDLVLAHAAAGAAGRGPFTFEAKQITVIDEGWALIDV